MSTPAKSTPPETGTTLNNGWSVFFDEVTALLTEAERQYGLANRNYTEYVLERMEMTLSTCSFNKIFLIWWE